MKIINITWPEIESLISKLTLNIHKKYDVIIGVNRGGLIPSVILSHLTKIKHGVTTIESYQGRKKSDTPSLDYHISMIGKVGPDTSILLVDDISDSGESLIQVIEVLCKLGCQSDNIDTATLHYKNKSKFKPTFYAKKVQDDDWVNYPWEKY